MHSIGKQPCLKRTLVRKRRWPLLRRHPAANLPTCTHRPAQQRSEKRPRSVSETSSLPEATFRSLFAPRLQPGSPGVHPWPGALAVVVAPGGGMGGYPGFNPAYAPPPGAGGGYGVPQPQQVPPAYHFPQQQQGAPPGGGAAPPGGGYYGGAPPAGNWRQQQGPVGRGGQQQRIPEFDLEQR